MQNYITETLSNVLPGIDLKKLHIYSEIKYKKLIDRIEHMDKCKVLEKT